ncbi:hypothetical protein Goshw_027298, partial [Gossypium schwendimanii]|nr:hypothetical protein [Gossypium schwendimanii]
GDHSGESIISSKCKDERNNHGFGHIQSERANTTEKKKKSLCVTWSDEDSSSGSGLEDDHQNFIAFTANVGNEDSNIESCGEIDEDFVKTYKEMLGKWEMVLAAKEALLVEELSNMMKINEELVDVKLMLEKFYNNNNRLDELLAPEKGIHVDGV